MPLMIVPTLDDYLNSRQVVHVPDASPYAAFRADPGRPEGRDRPQGGGVSARLPRDPHFIVGLDLGQANDHTAMCAVEMMPHPAADPDATAREAVQPVAPRSAKTSAPILPRYRLPFITRAPLGTPYPSIVRRVAETVTAAPLAGACHLVVDATGVGRPVLDMLRSGPLPPVPVVITGGDRVHGAAGIWRVPKRDLVTALQLSFQSGRIEIAAGTDHAQTLVAELADFRVRIGASGLDTYGAWREGAHDDLVLALALAVWWGDRMAARGARLARGASGHHPAA